ncbi:hypothetical protein LguiA_021122 [Lonicera macranthoides]
MGGATGGRSLEETSRWAVAAVCFVLVATSMVIERLIHLVEQTSSSSDTPSTDSGPSTITTTTTTAQLNDPTSGYPDNGKVPFVSSDGIHQLHVFIFVLALFHVLCCILTMTLGRFKVCFYRQFIISVPKVDYLTLRHGFIQVGDPIFGYHLSH